MKSKQAILYSNSFSLGKERGAETGPAADGEVLAGAVPILSCGISSEVLGCSYHVWYSCPNHLLGLMRG